MQRSRRTNPYATTWEIPLALLVAILALLLAGVQAGRSAANTIAGNGWVFIDRSRLFSSLDGIVSGQADAGLTGVAHPAGKELLWTCIVFIELVILAGCITVLKWGLDRWGPTRLQGMATRTEAEALLGRTRLHKHATVIRPDLYGPSERGPR